MMSRGKASLAIFPSFFFSNHFIHLPFVADNTSGITGYCRRRVKTNLIVLFSGEKLNVLQSVMGTSRQQAGLRL